MCMYVYIYMQLLKAPFQSGPHGVTERRQPEGKQTARMSRTYISFSPSSGPQPKMTCDGGRRAMKIGSAFLRQFHRHIGMLFKGAHIYPFAGGIDKPVKIDNIA